MAPRPYSSLGATAKAATSAALAPTLTANAAKAISIASPNTGLVINVATAGYNRARRRAARRLNIAKVPIANAARSTTPPGAINVAMRIQKGPTQATQMRVRRARHAPASAEVGGSLGVIAPAAKPREIAPDIGRVAII